MRFVLEESSWAWDGVEREVYIERIEKLLDRLDAARERDEVYARSHELLAQTILPGTSLAELLWNPEAGLRLPRDVEERINALFGIMPCWEEVGAANVNFEVRIAGQDKLSLSAAFAHAKVMGGYATACFPLPGTIAGPCSVVVDGIEAIVHFVVDERTHRAFFRDALDVEGGGEAALASLAPHAFPCLFFLDDIWDGLRLLEGGYARVRAQLHHALSVLDDHGAWVFTDTTGRLSPNEQIHEEKNQPLTDSLIERRFRGFSLVITPEHADVRAKERYRKPRERLLGGRTLYCEWHYKFEPYTNRMHIHAPVAESGGKTIIAILRDHLPLPGYD